MVCLLRVGLTGDDEPTDGSIAATDEHFGIYVIDRRDDGSLCELGRGATGVTYRATDTSLQRKVALKIINMELGARSSDARERFMRGARAAASLRHENVATIYQFGIGEDTGQCFYAMELIEGETLEERVRRTGPLDASTVITIGQQVADALADAEKRGLVHRDLKPANLMLADSDQVMRVKVIDFGLAKAIQAGVDPMTLTHGGFVGTPAFASPEQFSQSALDIRSDIYSLGGALYFALTGQAPFPGRSIEEIRRSQQMGMIPIQRLKAARVPRGLIGLLKAMLAVEPAARPGVNAVLSHLCELEGNRQRWRRRLVSAGVALVFVFSAVAWLHPREGRLGAAARFNGNDLMRWLHFVSSGSLTEAEASVGKAVLVLPFTNLSRDSGSAYLAEGLRDQIQTRLVKLADLKIISFGTADAPQGNVDDLYRRAGQAGVTRVLQGSVQVEGDLFRAIIQLVDVQNGTHLWAETYDRKLSDLLQVEREVAEDVASALSASLTDREKQAMNAKTTSNAEAHEAYLKGRYFWNTRSWKGYEQSRQYFSRAIALDPNYAQAYVGLADAFQFLAGDVGKNPRESYDQAKAANRKALELDPSLAEAHASLGLIAMNDDWDWAAAEREYKRAIELNPSYAMVRDWYSEYLMAVGRPEESLQEMRKARELGPFSLVFKTDLGKMLFFARRYDEAIENLNETLKTDPNNDGAHFWLGWVYAARKKYDQALAEFERIDRDSRGSGSLGGQGYVYGIMGKRQQAEQMLAAVTEYSPTDPQPRCWIHIALGDKDKAFACLEEEFKLHATGLISLKTAPHYDFLRSDPRFLDLLRRVHLTP